MALETLLILTGCVVVLAVFAWRALRDGLTQPAAETDARCAGCKFFELEGAQDAMGQNKAFVQMTKIQTPYQAGRKVSYEDGGPCPDCDPNSNEGCKTCSGDRRLTKAVYKYPTHLTPQAKWSEYGWCTHPNVVYDNDVPFNERILWGGAANCEGELFQLRVKQSSLKLVS